MEDAPRKDDAPSEDQASKTTTGIYIKPSSFSLDKWTNDVRSAAAERVEDVLNRSAFTVGLQIPRARVDETVAAKELVQAGTDAGLASPIAESIAKRALRDGKMAEQKRLDKRQRGAKASNDSPPSAIGSGGAS